MTTMFTGKAAKGALLATAALGMGIAAAPAHAAAFYLQEQSTKAVGRAFSGEVSERGAQQMWWNPAAVGGITNIQGYFGVSAILPRANSTNVGTTVYRPGVPPLAPASVVPVGGSQNEHDPVNDGYLPNGGFAVPLGEHFAFGVTATSPYSFTTNYANDSWARYSADKTRLRTYDIQPVLAYSIGGLSVGAGPNIEYVRATLSNYLPNPLSPLLPDGHQQLKGDGWNVGFSLGFQYHNDKVDIGASYKSRVKHKLDGNLTVSGFTGLAAAANTSIDGAKANFSTPWQVNLGMRYHVTPQFTLNGQITRMGWEKFDAIDVYNLGPLGSESMPENYHNTFSYAVGFDYDVTPAWTLRGGVQRDLSPISAGQRDPRVPDGSRWNFALGSTYKLNQHFAVDVAASYDKIKSNPIDKDIVLATGAVFNDGVLRNARALVFSLGGNVTF